MKRVVDLALKQQVAEIAKREIALFERQQNHVIVDGLQHHVVDFAVVANAYEDLGRGHVVGIVDIEVILEVVALYGEAQGVALEINDILVELHRPQRIDVDIVDVVRQIRLDKVQDAQLRRHSSLLGASRRQRCCLLAMNWLWSLPLVIWIASEPEVSTVHVTLSRRSTIIDGHLFN